MDRIMRMKEVAGTVGLSKAQIYLMMRAAEFPPPLQLGRRAVGWRESQIREWLDTRMSA